MPLVTWGPSSGAWYFRTESAPIVNAKIEVTSVNPDPIVAGSSITIYYTVTNKGNVAYSFGVGSEIWEVGSKKDDVGEHMTPTISVGCSYDGLFSYTIPPGWSEGTYAARCAVWTGWPGSSTWLDSYDRNFTVQVQPLTIDGRIAYHSYSNYLAVPAQDDTEDGNVFIHSFAGGGSLMNLTESLPIVNAMNPHFSPDGSILAFMAVPIEHADDIEYDSQSGYWHRLRNNLEIYVYDLASENLNQLTDNSIPDEDAKFSPDGRRIVFKRSSSGPDSGQVWIMNANGSSAQQKTYTPDQKSGPNFSPDGSHIVYWSSSDANADIWLMMSDGTSAAQIIGTSGLSEYYPI